MCKLQREEVHEHDSSRTFLRDCRLSTRQKSHKSWLSMAGWDVLLRLACGAQGAWTRLCLHACLCLFCLCLVVRARLVCIPRAKDYRVMATLKGTGLCHDLQGASRVGQAASSMSTTSSGDSRPCTHGRYSTHSTKYSTFRCVLHKGRYTSVNVLRCRPGCADGVSRRQMGPLSLTEENKLGGCCDVALVFSPLCSEVFRWTDA